jgi:hypothetical protein
MALTGLSPRERQIMEILYRRGKVSVSQVMEAMEDAPGYSAVRAMMRVLEEKGTSSTRPRDSSTSTSLARGDRAARSRGRSVLTLPLFTLAIPFPTSSSSLRPS